MKTMFDMYILTPCSFKRLAALSGEEDLCKHHVCGHPGIDA